MKKNTSIMLTYEDYERLSLLLDTINGPKREELDPLRAELDRASIVERHDIPATVVTMNAKVRCVDMTTGIERNVTLVYPSDSNSAEGRISVLAPFGSALLGLSVGQTIDWQVMGGRRLKLKVLGVSHAMRETA